MKTNKNVAILIFFILLMTIGAVFILKPKSDVPIRFDFNQAAMPDKVLVYFSKSKGSEIVIEPVSRKLPDPKPTTGKALLGYTVTQLLAGPTEDEQDQGYFSEIPAGTKLLSVKESNKAITIDLSGEYGSGGGSNSMIQRLQELTKTVVSVPQKKPVYINVDGKPLEVLGGEGVMVHEPITEDPGVTR
jgi:spore germination protein GerM